jgi:DNA-binding transcriptional ArsR family regulator
MSSLMPKDYEIKYRPNIEALNETFADVSHWPVFAVWKLIYRDGKPTKVPCDLTGQPISVTQPWFTLEQAIKIYLEGKSDGIGTKLGCGDPEEGYLCVIDLDCKDGKPEDLQLDLAYLRENCGFVTYAEYSPSGRGAHLLFWAKLDEPYVNTTIQLPHGTRMEVYAYTDEKRFVTITGARIPGFPWDIRDRTKALENLKKAYPKQAQETIITPTSGIKGRVEFTSLPPSYKRKSRKLARKNQKFSYLFNKGYEEGDFTKYPPRLKRTSTSAARSRRSSLRKRGYTEEELPFYLDLAYRASALYREKWDESRGEGTYGSLTISKVLAEQAFPPIQTMSATDILSGNFDPPQERIEGLLTRGIALVAGRAKAGKTQLCMQGTISLATGEEFLGHKVIPCGVLYLALEESPGSVQARLHNLGLIPGALIYPIYFSWDLQPLGSGGEDQLADFLQKHPEVQVVIIDPFVYVSPKTNRKDLSWYEQDYQKIEILRPLVREREVTIILVHHLRKQEAEDPLLTVSGSTGLIAAVDTIWILQPKGNHKAALTVRGRHLKSEELALQFDGLKWTYLGDGRLLDLPSTLKLVLDALSKSGEASLKDLAQKTGYSESQLRKYLQKLIEMGYVEQVERGIYRSLLPKFGSEDEEVPF